MALLSDGYGGGTATHALLLVVASRPAAPCILLSWVAVLVPSLFGTMTLIWLARGHNPNAFTLEKSQKP